MKRLVSTIAAGTLAALMSTGLATAQTPTPSSPPAAQPKAPPAAAAKNVEAKAAAKTGAKAATKPRSPESIACSAEADKKNLHGKERKTFRAKCVRDMKKAAGGTAAAGAPTKAAAPATPPAAKTK